MTAPDFADRIAAQLVEEHLAKSPVFDPTQRRIITHVAALAARAGYRLRDGVRE